MKSMGNAMNGQPLDDASLDAVSGGKLREKILEHIIVHVLFGGAVRAVTSGVNTVKEGVKAVAAVADGVARAQGSPRQ
jgi:hypothetical protein